MSARFTLPQEMKWVEGMAPAADAAGRASDWVSMKNYGMCFILVSLTQGNAATVALTPLQATAVAGTGSKAIANAVPIWSNLDTSLTDTLVRQTDAVSYTTDAAVKNKQVVFMIDATQLDVANNFDCVSITTGASNAANITAVNFFLAEPRFNNATPPSAIID